MIPYTADPDFFYNANGTPIAMRQSAVGSTNYTIYYYITNLQGDVIRLVDHEGRTAAYYRYDPYGKVIEASGSHANINPLRYRGYYYDVETGLYYLQSRYYDPQVCRFINADAFTSTGQGLLGNNMFSYCLNNPVNYHDRDGQDAIWIQEENSASVAGVSFGHSGLLVQDSNGNWWYFYWGPDNPDVNIVSMCVNTPEICVYMRLSTFGQDMSNFDSMIEVISRYTNHRRVGEQASEITSALYYEGDYTATHEFLLKYTQTAENSEVHNYSLIFNNCSELSAYAMSLSDDRFSFKSKTVPLIPNLTYRYLLKMGGYREQQFELAYLV